MLLTDDLRTAITIKIFDAPNSERLSDKFTTLLERLGDNPPAAQAQNPELLEQEQNKLKQIFGEDPEFATRLTSIVHSMILGGNTGAKAFYDFLNSLNISAKKQPPIESPPLPRRVLSNASKESNGLSMQAMITAVKNACAKNDSEIAISNLNQLLQLNLTLLELQQLSNIITSYFEAGYFNETLFNLASQISQRLASQYTGLPLPEVFAEKSDIEESEQEKKLLNDHYQRYCAVFEKRKAELKTYLQNTTPNYPTHSDERLQYLMHAWINITDATQRLDIFKFLIQPEKKSFDYFALLSQKNNDGNTLLHLMAMETRFHANLFTLLQNHLLPIVIYNNKGETPFDVLEETANREDEKTLQLLHDKEQQYIDYIKFINYIEQLKGKINDALFDDKKVFFTQYLLAIFVLYQLNKNYSNVTDYFAHPPVYLLEFIADIKTQVKKLDVISLAGVNSPVVTLVDHALTFKTENNTYQQAIETCAEELQSKDHLSDHMNINLKHIDRSGAFVNFLATLCLKPQAGLSTPVQSHRRPNTPPKLPARKSSEKEKTSVQTTQEHINQLKDFCNASNVANVKKKVTLLLKSKLDDNTLSQLKLLISMFLKNNTNKLSDVNEAFFETTLKTIQEKIKSNSHAKVAVIAEPVAASYELADVQKERSIILTARSFEYFLKKVWITAILPTFQYLMEILPSDDPRRELYIMQLNDFVTAQADSFKNLLIENSKFPHLNTVHIKYLFEFLMKCLPENDPRRQECIAQRAAYGETQQRPDLTELACQPSAYAIGKYIPAAAPLPTVSSNPSATFTTGRFNVTPLGETARRYPTVRFAGGNARNSAENADINVYPPKYRLL